MSDNCQVSAASRPPKTDIISPHYDDAVYSSWHAINNQARVVTVFGGYPKDELPSDWDISTGFSNSREAIEAREGENNAALRPTGALSLNLPFKDTVFRQEGELSPEELSEHLAKILYKDSQVLAPIGFSFSYWHPDHVLTREAAKLLMHMGKQVTYYADIPYVLKPGMLSGWPNQLPTEAIKRILDTDVEVLPIELDDDTCNDKEAAVKTYASQFSRNNSLSGYVFDDPQAFRWECEIKPI